MWPGDAKMVFEIRKEGNCLKGFAEALEGKVMQICKAPLRFDSSYNGCSTNTECCREVHHVLE